MIQLPACPPIREAIPRFVSFAVDQTPELGGERSRVSRLGDRWAIDVETKAAEYAQHGMTYLSRLVRGMTDHVLLAFPEPGVEPKAYGAPVVAAAGAAGLTLPVSGLIAGVAIPEGKFFSIVIGGQRFLYQVAADAVASAGGTADLSIYPMLRRQPPAGAVVEIEAPKIEGFVQGNQQDWNVSQSKYLPFRFSIEESA